MADQRKTCSPVGQLTPHDFFPREPTGSAASSATQSDQFRCISCKNPRDQINSRNSTNAPELICLRAKVYCSLFPFWGAKDAVAAFRHLTRHDVGAIQQWHNVLHITLQFTKILGEMRRPRYRGSQPYYSGKALWLNAVSATAAIRCCRPVRLSKVATSNHRKQT